MNQFFDLSSIFTTLITMFLSFLIAYEKFKKENVYNSKKEMYETLYVPYIKLLYSCYSWEIRSRRHDFDTIVAFFELINKNLHLLELKALKLYPDYFCAYIEMKEFCSLNLDYLHAPDHYEVVFNEMTLAILETAFKLSKELKLPPLAEPLLSVFSELYHKPSTSPGYNYKY